jgi:hypothetical protein
MKKIICLYGGPGSGKSTTCAGVFYKLKLMNYNGEMNREYVKDWVWEDRKIQVGDQPYFFSKMARKERMYMKQKLDFIVTDSPLILTHFYGLKYDEYEQKFNTSLNMLKNHHEICIGEGYKTEHFYLNRVKPYQPAGRQQTEDVAKNIDVEIKDMLKKIGIKFMELPGDEKAVDVIVNSLISIPYHTISSFCEKN